MKITCDRELLSTAFHTAAMVAPAKSPKSILQNVKIDALKDQVTLMATDMEVGIRLTVRGWRSRRRVPPYCRSADFG
jgi:DNA polymerase III subunit beta